jgi:O-acetylserine/cysteine efflux transporter
MTTLHLVLMAAIDLAWGLNVPAAKYAVSQMPPVWCAGWRLSLVGFFLLPWLRWLPGRMAMLMTVCLCMGVLQFGFLFAGFGLSHDISVMSVVMQVGIPVSALIGFLQFRDRLNIRAWCGVGLACAGVVWLTFDPRVFDAYLLGVVFVAIGSVVGTYGMALTRYLREVATLTILGWSGVVSGPVLLLWSLAFEPAPVAAALEAPPLAWACVLFTALATSILGQGGATYLIKHYPVGIVFTATLLSSPISVAWGIVVNGEPLTLRFIAGAVTVLVGVALVTARDLKFRRAA